MEKVYFTVMYKYCIDWVPSEKNAKGPKLGKVMGYIPSGMIQKAKRKLNQTAAFTTGM